MFKTISSKYTVEFNDLMDFISEDKLENYTNKIAPLLNSQFNPRDFLTYFKWTVRCYFSSKHVLISALFFKQSEYLIRRSMGNLIYYLLYYSWYHATCSIYCLLPNISFKKLEYINHGKILTEFNKEFVESNMLGKDVTDLHNYLLMCRETFSYQIPLSGGEDGSNSIQNPEKLFDRVSNYLPMIVQLANLLSFCAYDTKKKEFTSDEFNTLYMENQIECDEIFFKAISIRDRLGYNCIIDDFDYRRLARTCKNLNGPFMISVFMMDTFLEDLEDGWDRENLDDDAFDIYEVFRILVKWNMTI